MVFPAIRTAPIIFTLRLVYCVTPLTFALPKQTELGTKAGQREKLLLVLVLSKSILPLHPTSIGGEKNLKRLIEEKQNFHDLLAS